MPTKVTPGAVTSGKRTPDESAAARAAAARTAAAAAAADALAAVLKSADESGAAVIVARYGADIDRAAVTLARRAAMEMSGAAKSRGGARARVLSVVALIDGTPVAAASPLSDALIVAAARSVLDEHSRGERERRERRAALAKTVNDSNASAEERAAALSVVTGMDAETASAKSAAARARFDAALSSAIGALPLAYILRSVLTLALTLEGADALAAAVQSATEEHTAAAAAAARGIDESAAH